MISKNLNENKVYYKRIFENDSTVLFRDIENENGLIKCCIIFVQGMINSETLSKTVVLPIQKLSVERVHSNMDLIMLLQKRVLTSETVEIAYDEDQIAKEILYGDSFLMVDGYSVGLMISTRGWETRNVSLPESERVIKGAKEAFTEAVITNISLIKRKILDPSLKFEAMEIGKKTRTKIFVTYVEDVVDKKLVKEVKKRLGKIDIDAVLDANYIAENICDFPFSLFKIIGDSERPDVIAAKLLEGKVGICCDGTPEILFVPYLFYEQFQVSEDYYNNYIFAGINRMIRIMAFVLSSSIAPIYIALVTFHQQMLPKEIFMSIAASRINVPFPSFMEISLMLVVFELLREAGTRLPKNIGQAISIVGALVLGDAAVRAQIVSAPVVIIAALSGISSMMLNHSVTAQIVIRFGLLVLCGLYGMYGYIFGVMIIATYLIKLTSFGVPYMTYIYNPRYKGNEDSIFRFPWNFNKNNVNDLLEKNDDQVDKKC